MGFDRIKTILDQGLAAWEQQNGPAALHGHGPTFKWDTKENLLAAIGHGKQLIQPDLVGKDGASANLVIDLRTGIASPAFRMPKGGPFIPDAEVQEIVDWINQGCPD
ncbi:MULTISPECIES: cytochrome c [unclassified Bradyrhizobium]|uniref:c-type cytochrome n=1 Tax=unclassified Bradyrhizobium TaxID=2631580 RepID=UPI0028E7854D|nr:MULTISPECIES: cytochrome c [unclassified Bradyrhizobium]